MMARTKKAAAPKAAVEIKKVLAFKGFDQNLCCSGGGSPFQFEIGKSYEVEGDVKACGNGFHACEYPLSVFTYYAPATSRFAIVELEGDMDVDGDKTAARRITIVKELTLKQMIEEAAAFTLARAKVEEGATASGDQGAATASGYQGAATASGYQGAATASGDQGAATASGYQGAATASGTRGAATASGTRGAATASGTRGAATASGDQGAATASGTRGAATASGYQGAATASGDQGAATASGYQGAATASGDQGAATASGYQGAATASGDQGAATASGYQGAATASGTRGAATASGTRGAATASGIDGKAQGKDGCALFLAERVDDTWSEDYGKILHVWAGIVGQDGIKPDTFYRLVDGKPVEVE